MTHAWRHVSSLIWFVKNSCRSSGCWTWRRGCSGRGGGAQAHLNSVLKRDGESRPRGQSRTSDRSSRKADLHVGTEEEGLFNRWGRLTMHRKSLESGGPPVTESATSKTEQESRLMRQPLGFLLSILVLCPRRGKGPIVQAHY